VKLAAGDPAVRALVQTAHQRYDDGKTERIAVIKV
jgi:hypothetical protein